MQGCTIVTWTVAIMIIGDGFLLLTISLSDNSGSFAVFWENNTHNKIYLLQRQRYYRSFLI